MIIRKDSWSLILVGHWNRFILSPQWTCNNLFDETELKLEYPINDPTKPLRYRFIDSNIVFIPANHRITTVAQPDYSDEMLKKIVIANKNLVDTLSHTPISALGINLAFEVNARDFNFLNVFELPDAGNLNAIDLNSNKFEIKRIFDLDLGVLNLTISNDDKIYFDFNYHYEIEGALEASEILEENLMINKKKHALETLERVYELELELHDEEVE